MRSSRCQTTLCRAIDRIDRAGRRLITMGTKIRMFTKNRFSGETFAGFVNFAVFVSGLRS
jgi:hypothetical protein